MPNQVLIMQACQHVHGMTNHILYSGEPVLRCLTCGRVWHSYDAEFVEMLAKVGQPVLPSEADGITLFKTSGNPQDFADPVGEKPAWVSYNVKFSITKPSALATITGISSEQAEVKSHKATARPEEPFPFSTDSRRFRED